MKHVNVDHLLTQIVEPPKLMSKREKLMHWAKLIRECPYQLTLLTELEYVPLKTLRATKPPRRTAMCLATEDETLQRQGLSKDASMLDVLEFFGISPREIHDGACDCHGHISNGRQAAYLEWLAMNSR